MSVAIEVDCCVGVALASGRAALEWLRSEGPAPTKLRYILALLKHARQGSIPRGVNFGGFLACLAKLT